MASGGLRNLGASCFVNAGIQALLSVPRLAACLQTGANPTEEAFNAVVNMLSSQSHAVIPEPVTNMFYEGRQEDSAEFILRLLSSCPSVQGLFRGEECPRFKCQHCTYSRPLAPDSFMSLQVPLMVGTPVRSVQEALDKYLNAEHLQENVQDWFCCGASCLNEGRATDMPVHQTRITQWPDTLVIFLKRWDNVHGLLTHKVYCNNILAAENNHYRLKSVVAHIGATPTSGHYVAYGLRQNGFMRMDDGKLTPAEEFAGYFTAMPEEKVYVVMYTKNQEDATAAIDTEDLKTPNEQPPFNDDLADNSDTLVTSKKPCSANILAGHAPEAPDHNTRGTKRPAIDLDSDTDLDTNQQEDTLMQADKDFETAAGEQPPIAIDLDSEPELDTNKEKNTGTEADKVDQEADTDSDVVPVHSIDKNDQGDADHLTSDAEKPPSQLDRDPPAAQEDASTAKRLKNFRNFTAAEQDRIADILKNNDSFETALKELNENVAGFTTKDTASRTYLTRRLLKSWHADPGKAAKAVASCSRSGVSRKNATPETPQRIHRIDRITAGTARARLGADDHETVANALQASETTQDMVQALSESLPGFSSTDRNATRYLPRSTLTYWLSHKNKFNNQPTADSPTSWEAEQNMQFAVAFQLHNQRSLPVLADSDLSGLWLQNGSWTFCPRCGRHRARSSKFPLAADHSPVAACQPACDRDALLLLAAPQKNMTIVNKLEGYVTPAIKHWQLWTEYISSGQLPFITFLSKEELHNLAVVDIKVDFRSRRGGSAEVTSKQKKTVVRCRWRSTSLMTLQRGDAAARAFQWLLNNNSTYSAYVARHHEMTLKKEQACDWREIPTAELLLNSPGLEVAARPWLYPVASYGDTDISQRLQSLGWVSSNQKPSIRAAFLRKLTSRCVDYTQDFPLQCLLYDVVMAKTISSVLNIAIQKNAAPERICSDMDTFEGYWLQQLRKMEDICRQEHEKSQDMAKALPNVFFTVAPSEWKYLLPKGVFFEDSLSNQQLLLTLHLHNTLAALLEAHILKDGHSLAQIGLARVRQWSLRFEFQARGTLHVHVVLWADLQQHWTPEDLNGRSNSGKSSAFLRLLEETFKCRADVQCGDGSHVLLKYVAGYLAKASDALQFQGKQARAEGQQAGQWRQTYRLLSKRSPMEQEITMEFAGLQMVKHSFSGIEMFAPQPGSKAQNFARHHYDVYQHYMKQPVEVFGCAQDMNFIQWLRKFSLASADPKEYRVRARNQAGPAAGKACGVAMAYPFELLDIFIGAWACACVPNMLEARLAPDTPAADMYPASHRQEWLRRTSVQAPDGCSCLKTVLCLDEFQLENAPPSTFSPDVGKLLSMIEPELNFRGIGQDRINTFKAKIHSCSLLLQKIANKEEDPALWSARRPTSTPARQWSSQQLQVLERIEQGLSISNAAEQEAGQRVVQVSGGPGTGKTEVIIEATRRALEDGCRVLIVGPIGLLVSMYRPALHETKIIPILN